MMKIFANTECELGEGIFWHPKRKSIFWFDILGKCLFEKKWHDQGIYDDQSFTSIWRFDEYVSAAAWIDVSQLLLASETKLFVFDLATSDQKKVCDLEADKAETRSNDGRADPQGGFWISTMGKKAEEKAGAIYRFYRGELRQFFKDLTIPNAICFSPDGQNAFFTDTVTRIVKQVALDADGWPIEGTIRDYLNLNQDELNPDGAVVDQAGNFWNAQWGASRVACYGRDTVLKMEYKAIAPHISCPAFGGEEMNILFATSAQEHLTEDVISKTHSGAVFYVETKEKGQTENQFIL